MKKITITLLSFLMLASLMTTSCSPAIKQIGKLNMISNRNVNPNAKYVSLSTYAGGSKHELKKTRATTIEDAVVQTVKKIPGGEFLTNVKIYIVEGKYFAVEGDVWGIKKEASFRGFKVGDKVIIDGLKKSTATIKSLKDDKTCFIEKENGKIVEIKYDKISKME